MQGADSQDYAGWSVPGIFYIVRTVIQIGFLKGRLISQPSGRLGQGEIRLINN